MATPLEYLNRIMPQLRGNYPLVPINSGLPAVIPPNGANLPVPSPRVFRPPALLNAGKAIPATAGLGTYLQAANIASLPASAAALVGQGSMAIGNKVQKDTLNNYPIAFNNDNTDNTVPQTREQMARRNDVMGISHSASDAWRAPEPWPTSKHEVYTPPIVQTPLPNIVRTPIPEIAPKVSNKPVEPNSPAPPLPQYDPQAENAVMKQIGVMHDLSNQGRSANTALADRLGALDISGKSAPFLGTGVINSELGLLKDNANSYNTEAGHVGNAIPAINQAINLGSNVSDAAALQKFKSKFEESTDKGRAEIEGLKAHANYFNSAHNQGKPAEATAGLIMDAINQMTPAEKLQYGKAALPNNTKNPPKDTENQASLDVWKATAAMNPAGANQLAKEIYIKSGGQIQLPVIPISK